MPRITTTFATVTPESRERMPLTLTAPPPEFSARYPDKSPEYVEAAWHYRELCLWKESSEAAQAILDRLPETYGLPSLAFDHLHNGRIIAKDYRGFRHAIIGQWTNSGNYAVYAVVRERQRGKPFTWELNGKASTGAVQVAFYGEYGRAIQFPANREVIEKWLSQLK